MKTPSVVSPVPSPPSTTHRLLRLSKTVSCGEKNAPLMLITVGFGLLTLPLEVCPPENSRTFGPLLFATHRPVVTCWARVWRAVDASSNPPTSTARPTCRQIPCTLIARAPISLILPLKFGYTGPPWDPCHYVVHMRAETPNMRTCLRGGPPEPKRCAERF